MAEPSAVLVQRAQAGDRDALSALVQSQQTYVYSIAMSLMHNPADAADMTQEAFIRLLRSIKTYRAENAKLSVRAMRPGEWSRIHAQ